MAEAGYSNHARPARLSSLPVAARLPSGPCFKPVAAASDTTSYHPPPQTSKDDRATIMALFLLSDSTAATLATNTMDSVSSARIRSWSAGEASKTSTSTGIRAQRRSCPPQFQRSRIRSHHDQSAEKETEEYGDDWWREWWKEFDPPAELSLDLMGSAQGDSEPTQEAAEIVRRIVARPVTELRDLGGKMTRDEDGSEGDTGHVEKETEETEASVNLASGLNSDVYLLGAPEQKMETTIEKTCLAESKSLKNDSGAGRRKKAGSVLKKALGKLDKSILKKSVRQETECVSCLEEHPSKRTLQLPCRHSYCLRCLRALVLVAIQDEALFPPRCCTIEIPKPLIRAALSLPQYLQYRSRSCELSIPVEDRIYCPYRFCGAVMERRSFPPDVAQFPCQRCFRWICRYCKQKSHGGGKLGECPNDQYMQALLQAAEKRGWKRCYKCKAFVELMSGCDHMRCRCGAQFCYQCGDRWKTCDCGLGIGRDEEEYLAQQRAFDEEDAAAVGLAPLGDTANTQATDTEPQDIEDLQFDSEPEYDSDIDDEIRAAFAASRVTYRAEARQRNGERAAAIAAARREARQRQRRRLRDISVLFTAAEKELREVHERQREMMHSRHWSTLTDFESRYLRETEKMRKMWAADVERCNKSMVDQLMTFFEADDYETVVQRTFERWREAAEKMNTELQEEGRKLTEKTELGLKEIRRTNRAENEWFDAVLVWRLEELVEKRREREREVTVWVRGELVGGAGHRVRVAEEDLNDEFDWEDSISVREGEGEEFGWWPRFFTINLDEIVDDD